MVHVHRELLDPALAPQAAIHVQKLRALHAQGVRWYVKVVTGDNYIARLRIAQDHLHVLVLPRGGAFYEFFTSDHVNDGTLGSPGHGAGITNTYVCGSAVRARFEPKRMGGRALSSSTLTGGSWVERGCEDLDQKTLGFYTYRSWQNQKFFEHCWHPNNDGKSLVTSCQAQAPGLAGQCGWMSPYNYRRIASAGSLVSDFGLDILPTLYAGNTMTTGAPALDNVWVYWRRAAVHSASGRQFFVSTDNYGRFQVYPVKSYADTSGIVPPSGYKQYTPPYPAWVTVPDPDNYFWQVNDWLWRFNKDATKCVSIPYHSTFPSGFSKFLAGSRFFATLVDAAVAQVHPDYANAVVPAREDTPGLVEFGIEIVLGDTIETNDMDFTVNFTLLRSEHFSVNGRFFFDAAYFLPDAEAAGIAEGTLLTAEVECRYPTGYYTATTGDGYYLDRAANVKGAVVINTNDGAMTKTEKLRFPCFPGGNGQFCTPAGYLFLGGGLPIYTGPGPIGNDIPYVSGTLFTGSAGPVSYTPPDPPFTASPPGGYGAQMGFLYSLELSTFSVLYQTWDEVAGTGLFRMLAYGQEVYSAAFSLGYTKPVSPWPAADAVMTSARWYQQVLSATINTEWGMGFSVHPQGHWAHAINAELGTVPAYAEAFDWISVKERDGTRSRYSHKDMFNQALGQARDYPYYTEAFTGKGLWDQGSFRTAGIWVTHR
jgi:hypothetical protein